MSRLTEIAESTARTLELLRSGALKQPSADLHPIYGYYEADIFDCPPFVMFTNNDCPRAREILYFRSFEPTSMKIWCRLARTATGVLDIGANVGVYALAAAALRNDVKIFAFEPNPHAYTRLRINKEINRFDNIFEHAAAAGDKNAHVHFAWFKKRIPQIASGGGVARGEPETHEQTVVRMTELDGTGLADLIGPRGLVKVDVEGGEMATFNGMKEIIARKPDIFLETFDRKACDVINGLLIPLGYRTFIVREKAGTLEPRDALTARDPKIDVDFNQYLTTRPAEVADLFG
jgi:FkbM family methyltransferase